MATCPIASVARTNASAYLVNGVRVVCHGGVFSRRRMRAASATTNSAASPSPASVPMAASVPAAPPTWSGKCSARRSSRASRTPWSHCAALRPKVIGTACWVRVRPAIRSSRCRWASSASDCTCRSRFSRSSPVVARAHITSAVSSTSWLVRPLCSQAAASGDSRRSRSSATRGTTGLPLDSAPTETSSRSARVTKPCRSASAPDGATPASTSACSQTCSTSTRVCRKSPSSKASCGALVAGPEEVRHQDPGKARKTVSPSPWSRMSKAYPSVVGAWRPASTDGPRPPTASSASPASALSSSGR